MIDKLQRVVAWLMNRVRVNQIQQSVHDGVPVFVKRRRAGGSIVIWFGNRFLALARSGICMFVRPRVGGLGGLLCPDCCIRSGLP